MTYDAATLAVQLALLSGDRDRGERLALAMSRLGTAVAGAVPSCLAVSIVLDRAAGAITVGTLVGGTGSDVVRASLAVPLSAAEDGDVLILRAGEPGAFLLLVDDLAGLLGPGYPPIEVDRHLSWPSAAPGESLPASLVDLSAVNQSVGVLLDQGFPLEAAHRELQRQADVADVSIGTAGRLLLESLPRAGPADPC
ncbi:MAG: hypothetical protein ABJC62_10405 [Frankiaceae bacterium]